VVGLRLEPSPAVPNVIGGFEGNSVSGGAVGAVIGGGGASGQVNSVTAEYGTVGGGQSNTAGASLATVGGGEGNTASGAFATVPGGQSNSAGGAYSFAAGLRAKANVEGAFVWADSIDQEFYATAPNQFAARATGGFKLWVDPAATGLRLFPVEDLTHGATVNVLAGHGGNHATPGVVGGTIGGGGCEGAANSVWGAFGTVGGGDDNTASGYSATVAGGESNTAGSNDYATVGGGYDNTASGAFATVVGGDSNTASGFRGTVVGGVGNVAYGGHSLAAGRRAEAEHDGAFVWADSIDLPFPSTADNEWSARATGGARFVLSLDGRGNPDWTCSVSNGATWFCSSDRNLKEDLVAVDGEEVLTRLIQVPVYTWRAKGSDARHMGPMAQDFHAAFEVGENDTSLATIDLDGVALAAIQGLHGQNRALAAENMELRGRVDALETENAAQQAQIDDLAGRLEGVERTLSTAGRAASCSTASSVPYQRGLLPGVGMLGLTVAAMWGARRK
jgi:hypothetical protein